MHASTIADSERSQRTRFWGRSMSSRGETNILRLLSNDDTATMNFRVDTDSGRFLSFTKDGNHIRAGKHSPADALLSVYVYFAEILQDNETGAAYVDRITVPNLVGTGVFVDTVDPAFRSHGLVSSSSKFPGCAISLSTGCTPVVYPGVGLQNKTWILPGMTSVKQTFASIHAMHAVTHNSTVDPD